MAQYDPFEEFEESFRAALDFLTGQSGDDETLSTLTFVEDAADNDEVDDYVPDWLSPVRLDCRPNHAEPDGRAAGRGRRGEFRPVYDGAGAGDGPRSAAGIRGGIRGRKGGGR